MTGASIITESNLSKTPPCPGMRLPKSLILVNLFILEATRSPDWDIMDPTEPNTTATNKS